MYNVSCTFFNKCLFFIVHGWVLSGQTLYINIGDRVLVPAKTFIPDKCVLGFSTIWLLRGNMCPMATCFQLIHYSFAIFKIEGKHENLNYWLKISELSGGLVVLNDSLNRKRVQAHHPPHLQKVPIRKEKFSVHVQNITRIP